MTKNQKIAIGAAALLLLIFGAKKAFAAKPAVSGSVDFEPPTVSGLGAEQFGGRDYPVQVEPSDSVRDAINRSADILDKSKDVGPAETGDYGRVGSLLPPPSVPDWVIR